MRRAASAAETSRKTTRAVESSRAAAERDHEAPPRRAGLEEARRRPLHLAQRLAALAVGKHVHELAAADLGERARHAVPEGRVEHRRARDERDAVEAPRERPGRLRHAVADAHLVRVRLLARLHDLERPHSGAHFM